MGETIGVEQVQRMTDTIVHHGRDDEGIHVPWLGLGTRRLSIIDRSGGQQPTFNEHRTISVVFNGEICNFPYRIWR